MATCEELHRSVMDAIRQERQRVKKSREANPARPHRITDYSAMVVSCSYKKSHRTFIGFSKSPVGCNYDTRIRNRLEELGPIGTKNNNCDNIIGACAEPHAANSVLQYFPGCKMTELQFSKAYRPRTAHRKVYCRNCKKTFKGVL